MQVEIFVLGLLILLASIVTDYSKIFVIADQNLIFIPFGGVLMTIFSAWRKYQ